MFFSSQEWFKDWLEEASKEEIVEFYVKKDKDKSEKIDKLQELQETYKELLIQKKKLHAQTKIRLQNEKLLSEERLEMYETLVQSYHIYEELIIARQQGTAAWHQKELNTKNFLIKQLKEERTKLQGENKILTKNLNDEVLELQNIEENAVEEESDKVRKEVKALKAKKSPKQQNNSKKSAPPDKETDVKQLEAANKKLQLEKKELQQALADVLEKHEQIICCRICEEKFDNSEERVPVKLKCSHVFCASCANSWLAAHVIILKLPCLKIFNFLFQGQKATCPQCRTIYRAGDIKPVNFNL